MSKAYFAGFVLGVVLCLPVAMAADKPVKVTAEEGDPPESYVDRVVWIDATENASKIYSVTGGDPAINGVYTYLAVGGDPGEGWTVFAIGDFNTWEVTEQTKAYVVLKVNRTTVDEAGEMKTVEERLKVPLVAPGTKEITIATLP